MTEKMIILEFRNEKLIFWGNKLVFTVYSLDNEGRVWQVYSENAGYASFQWNKLFNFIGKLFLLFILKFNIAIC